MSIGKKLLDVPFPEMVYQLASAIAKSQYKLDMSTIEILKVMGDKEEAPVYLPGILDTAGILLTCDEQSTGEPDDIITSMIGAGFEPTFYQFAETIIEVKIDISITHERESSRTISGEQTRTTRTTDWKKMRSNITTTTTPVDASYSSKYNYTTEGASLLRTRLVPVPPNTFLQRLLEMKSEAMQMAMDLKLRKAEIALENERDRINGELEETE